MFLQLLCLCHFGTVLSANILAVFPHTGKSHFDVFEPLVLEMTTRGHHLTVISFFPQKKPVENLTDISLVGVVPMFVNSLKFEHLTGMNPFADFMTITAMGVDSCEPIWMSSQVQGLLKSSKTFDLALVEMFTTDCFLGLVEYYKVPFIGISSSSIFPTMYQRLGSFDNPAYFPNLFLPFGPRMTFPQRLVNAVGTAVMRLARAASYSDCEHAVVRKALGRRVNLQSVAHNLSLLLVNSHHSVQGGRPLVPAVVEVGGLHLLPAKSLPEDLEKFLNESSEGAILFSMGSVLQSSSFPADKRQAFMDAFAELPVRVIMKWENSSLPGKPDNVRLSSWLPQRDILAHPKIVAFVGHGGLLSASEAVYEGLPMVLIPMFGDQPNNVAHLAAAGAAVKLDYGAISKETVLAALRNVLYESRYRDNARVLSEQFRDRPMAPLDTAVYWTEFVLRHKGAPHLRSPAVDMPWYQLWLLDVAITLILILAALLYILYYVARHATTMVARHLAAKHQDQKTTKKIN